MKLSILSKNGRLAPLSEELERPLMEVLWTKGSMKGRDLYTEIRRARDIAYTTALTVLDRLSKKGFIKKDRESGTILFTPRISRQDYESKVAESYVRKAFDISPDLAITAFADIFSKMPKGSLDHLERLLDKKRTGKDRG
jgi:predicted transcriptional regulator